MNCIDIRLRHCLRPTFVLRLAAAAGAVIGSAIGTAEPVSAANVLSYYGDDDGFGIGATIGTMNPDIGHPGPGEAPFTDVRLISADPFYVAPAFQPTGGFDAFLLPPGEMIFSAMLTMRAGSLDVGNGPIDGPNQIFLDGMEVPNLFSLFTANDGNGGDAIETRSIALVPEFFPLLADGNVSLGGSRISEEGGSGSFQIDFLRLDIATVPEPSTAIMSAVALGLLGRRRRTEMRVNVAETR